MSSAATTTTLRFKGRDDQEEVPVDRAEAERSIKTVADALCDDPEAETIPVLLDSVSSDTLKLVARFVALRAKMRSKGAAAEQAEKVPADGEDAKEVHQLIEDCSRVDAVTGRVNPAIFQMATVADYLHYTDLLDVSCQRIADLIKGKTPEEIRALFGIENDLTPEEERAIVEENKWAFD